MLLENKKDTSKNGTLGGMRTMKGMKRMGKFKFRKFRVSWSTGCIVIYPIKFFSTTTLSNINAFLRLAKRYSTNQERIELLRILREGAHEMWEPDTCRSWTWRKVKQIDTCIKKIEKQTWGS